MTPQSNMIQLITFFEKLNKEISKKFMVVRRLFSKMVVNENLSDLCRNQFLVFQHFLIKINKYSYANVLCNCATVLKFLHVEK